MIWGPILEFEAFWEPYACVYDLINPFSLMEVPWSSSLFIKQLRQLKQVTKATYILECSWSEDGP